MKSVEQSPRAIKQQLQKIWGRYFFHKAWFEKRAVFPYHFKLPKLTDKTMLHQFSEVLDWIESLKCVYESDNQHTTLNWRQAEYKSIGKQIIPEAIVFENVEAMAKY